MYVSLRYQDYQAAEIPTVEQDGAKVRVMAGDSHGATGPVAMRNPGLLLDVTLAKGASFSQEVCGFYLACLANQGCSAWQRPQLATLRVAALERKVKFLPCVRQCVVWLVDPVWLHVQVAQGWNGFVYVCDGQGSISGTAAAREQVGSL